MTNAKLDGAFSDCPELRSGRLVLRRPLPRDVARRHALGQHREIIEAYGFNPAAPFTTAHAEAAIRFIEAQHHAWVIDAGSYIGHIRFHSFVRGDRRAALAIGIDDPAFLGKGFGTEAIRLALAHIFDQGLHRVSSRVIASNTRAIACYRKRGFVEEGREREAALVGGKWQDDVIMRILERELAPTGK